MMTVLFWWVAYTVILSLAFMGTKAWHFYLRVIIYGLLGLLIEDVFTGCWSYLVNGDAALTSTTYLCMVPVYGISGYILEQLNGRPQSFWRRLKRAFLLDVPCIFVVEYAYGWILRAVIGRCPWDYTGARWSVSGLVRLDYGFYWLGLALCVPLLTRVVNRLMHGHFFGVDPRRR